MKFKIFTSKQAAQATMNAGSLVAGGMISSGVEGLTPIEDSKTRKGVLAALGILGSASIQGNSNGAAIVRNLLIGMGVRQAQRFIQEAATPSLPEADGTEMNKFLHGMFETGGGDQITTPQKRMGMGYRFTPQQQIQTAYQNPTRGSGRLEFPLT